jgi:hypothetical protein
VIDYNEEYPLPLRTAKGFASKQQPLQLSNLDAFGHRALRVKFASSSQPRVNLQVAARLLGFKIGQGANLRTMYDIEVSSFSLHRPNLICRDAAQISNEP